MLAYDCELLSVVAFLLKSDLHLATMCRSNSRCSNIEHILSLLTALAVLSLPIHIRIGSISVSVHTEAKRCVSLINDFGDHYELRPKTKIIFLLVLKH